MIKSKAGVNFKKRKKIYNCIIFTNLRIARVLFYRLAPTEQRII